MYDNIEQVLHRAIDNIPDRYNSELLHRLILLRGISSRLSIIQKQFNKTDSDMLSILNSDISTIYKNVRLVKLVNKFSSSNIIINLLKDLK